MVTPLFTLRVTLFDGTIIEWRNRSEQDCDNVKTTIWPFGITIRVNKTTTELVSPGRIKQVFFIEQDIKSEGPVYSVYKPETVNASGNG